MATGTAATAARQYSTQQVHYLRKGITYADNGSTVVVGIIPAGAQIIKPMSGVAVNVAFDGNSSNVLDVGASTDSGTNNFATNLSLASIAFVALDEAVTMTVSVDTTISALVTSTASATAGQGEIIICYVPDNDR
jgi:hypothetical protein